MRRLQCRKRKTRKLERCWRKFRLPADRQLFVGQCLLVKNLVHSAKMKYYSSLIEQTGSNQKELFRTIDHLHHRKLEKLYPKCSSTTKLTNHFASFFTNKTATIKKRLVMGGVKGVQDPLIRAISVLNPPIQIFFKVKSKSAKSSAENEQKKSFTIGLFMLDFYLTMNSYN